MTETTALPDRGPRAFSFSKVTAIFREMGWRATITGTFLFGARLWKAWWWDWSNGVTTRHRIPLSKLNLNGPNAEHAQFYEASDNECLPEILRKLSIPYKDTVFIDFGVGMGKTMFLAAEFPFKRIVGVELSPILSVVAQRNCQTFKRKHVACREFEVRCEDATQFHFPDTPVVIYMFNPFGEKVLTAVLTNLIRSIESRPRLTFLIYYNPNQSHVVDHSGAFEMVLEGTNEHDYRKLRYRVYRAHTVSPS